jgi:hypothetical protein
MEVLPIRLLTSVRLSVLLFSHRAQPSFDFHTPLNCFWLASVGNVELQWL